MKTKKVSTNVTAPKPITEQSKSAQRICILNDKTRARHWGELRKLKREQLAVTQPILSEVPRHLQKNRVTPQPGGRRVRSWQRPSPSRKKQGERYQLHTNSRWRGWPDPGVTTSLPSFSQRVCWSTVLKQPFLDPPFLSVSVASSW